ncbi:MAG: TonB-dependent receptor [Deltaproteobacteria bacterium]|nr:TonB-dependent receptor [Deltaproteobacteria bacterium]
MKKLILSLSIVMAFSSYCRAAAPEDKASVALTVGSRKDNLDWNIAGNSAGTNPNVLSELQWNDLGIYQVKVAGKVVFEADGGKGEGYYLRGFMDYGWVHSGTNQDSDYAGDNRTGEFSRSNNNADSGSVSDFSIGLGYRARYIFKESVLDFAPLGGYSRHRQNLKITDGYQTIPATGAFAGLDSSYNARWQGPWFGIDIDWLTEKVGLHGGAEYHIARYTAEADWNLRSDFNHPKSFEHKANGTGYVLFLGGDYTVWRKWALTADVNYQKWNTTGGTDRTYFSDGTTATTRLNEVNWTSSAYMLGIMRRF